MLEIDKEIFDRNLLLTQAYCEMQLANTDKPVAEILRSFNPEHNGKQIFSYEFNTYKRVIWSTDPWSDDLYNQLFEDQILHKQSAVILSDINIEFKGRVLVAEVDTTVTDGASESVSEAFIDGIDCPPIDTWFYKTQNNIGRIFYTWIPERFVGLVQDAIDINALECFIWEEDFVLRKEVNVPRHYTYQTKFPPAEKHKNTLFWILGFALLIGLIAYLVEKFTK